MLAPLPRGALLDSVPGGFLLASLPRDVLFLPPGAFLHPFAGGVLHIVLGVVLLLPLPRGAFLYTVFGVVLIPSFPSCVFLHAVPGVVLLPLVPSAVVSGGVLHIVFGAGVVFLLPLPRGVLFDPVSGVVLLLPLPRGVLLLPLPGAFLLLVGVVLLPVLLDPAPI